MQQKPSKSNPYPSEKKGQLLPPPLTRQTYDYCSKVGDEKNDGEKDALLGCHGEKGASVVAFDDM
jgi:hypothetical protein